MKQNKIHCENHSQEYHDYSWLTMQPAEEPYQTAENYGADLDQDARNEILTLQLKDLRNQIKEIKRELKMHIDNCPYSSIKVNK